MIDLLGWIPAAVLPFSTLIQLVKVVRSDSVAGVSVLSWVLFGFANLGAYGFTEKWLSLQAVLAFLLSAVLDFAIVILVLKKTRTGVSM